MLGEQAIETFETHNGAGITDTATTEVCTIAASGLFAIALLGALAPKTNVATSSLGIAGRTETGFATIHPYVLGS
jgi:hypothetical protein